MTRDGMKFVGMVLKTATKWIPTKDESSAQRIMQITVEVAGQMVDQVAQNLLQFGPEEDLNIEIKSRQLDMVRDRSSKAGQTFMDDLTKNRAI